MLETHAKPVPLWARSVRPRGALVKTARNSLGNWEVIELFELLRPSPLSSPSGDSGNEQGLGVSFRAGELRDGVPRESADSSAPAPRAWNAQTSAVSGSPPTILFSASALFNLERERDPTQPPEDEVAFPALSFFFIPPALLLPLFGVLFVPFSLL